MIKTYVLIGIDYDGIPTVLDDSLCSDELYSSISKFQSEYESVVVREVVVYEQ